MSGAPDTIVIRRFGPGDSITELTEFLHRAYKPLADMGLRFFATYQDDDATLRRVRAGDCYLAIQDGTLVGTVTFRDPGRSQGCPYYERGDVATFNQLAVDPDRRGEGIGRRLMTLVEELAIAAGAAEIACDTAESAAHLIALYERRGYRAVGFVDWRPTTNYRSVILSKALADS